MVHRCALVADDPVSQRMFLGFKHVNCLHLKDRQLNDPFPLVDPDGFRSVSASIPKLDAILIRLCSSSTTYGRYRFKNFHLRWLLTHLDVQTYQLPI